VGNSQAWIVKMLRWKSYSIPLILMVLAAGVSYIISRTPCPKFIYFISCFLLGLLSPRLAKYAISSLLRSETSDNPKSSMYNLDHARLNLELPPDCNMWMNMGYWKVSQNRQQQTHVANHSIEYSRILRGLRESASRDT
jgi:hypothetical protein